MGRGDEGALADLYDETSTLVYGMALSIMQSPSLATRLTQDIYAEVWRLAPRYSPSEGALAWLLSTAHRRLVEQLRVPSDDAGLQRYAALDGNGLGHPRHEGGPGSNAERTRMAWGSLRPIHRDAVALAYFGGYRQTEVARILGLPLGTVEARIRDGLAALHAAMGAGS